MKTALSSRLLATVVVAVTLAALMMGYNRSKIEWLDSTPADYILRHYREEYSHGFVFQAISLSILLVPLVLIIEGVARLFEKITRKVDFDSTPTNVVLNVQRSSTTRDPRPPEESQNNTARPGNTALPPPPQRDWFGPHQ